MSSVIRLASSLLILSSGVICAQTAPATIESALVGKEVVLKIDLPGSQKGVDLRFNKDSPMDWKEYDGRLRSFGVALRKGDTARITAIVRKSDLIEVQLDGGGFGTVRDDTTTTVTAKKIEKSDYEKRLEEEIASTTDDDKRRDLQRDLTESGPGVTVRTPPMRETLSMPASKKVRKSMTSVPGAVHA